MSSDWVETICSKCHYVYQIDSCLYGSHRCPKCGNSFPQDCLTEDIREVQRKHLEQVAKNLDLNGQQCLHNQCPQCHGTGVRLDGTRCIHSLSCPCPRCTPRM